MRYQDFYQLAGDELRPDGTAHVTLAIRADQKFATRNSMLNADTRFPGFAMRIKEDQCSYTNHQNDVTYYNMVNQKKFKISNSTTKFLYLYHSLHKLQRPNSNFCKPLKKIQNLSVQPGLRGSNDHHVGRKMATFQLFFSVGSI